MESSPVGKCAYGFMQILEYLHECRKLDGNVPNVLECADMRNIFWNCVLLKVYKMTFYFHINLTMTIHYLNLRAAS